jgi:hypothetical protein
MTAIIEPRAQASGGRTEGNLALGIVLTTPAFFLAAVMAVVAGFLASADADCITGTPIFVDGGLLWDYSEQ